MEETSVIPRKDLFGNPDRLNVQLSPDGEWISYAAPVEGVLNIWFAPRANLSTARAVTHDRGRGIRQYEWAQTNKHLLYLQDQNGDENWHVYRVDLDTLDVLDLTPFDGVQAHILERSDKYPDEIVLGINHRDPQWHDTYRVNLLTGQLTLLFENDRYMQVTVDNDYRLQFGVQTRDDGGFDYFKHDQEWGWTLWTEILSEDALATDHIEVDKCGETVYFQDSRSRNTAGLTAWDIKTRQGRLLAEDDKADAQDYLIHPATRRVQAVAFIYERKRWVVIDEDIAEDLQALAGLGDGEIKVVSRSLDDAYWIVGLERDDAPVQFYVYDRAGKQAEFLFSNRSVLEGKPLAKMHAVVIKSRDGLDLVGYYTLPPDSDRNGDGIPDQPLPMVFIPHGGPWGRDFWRLDLWHQWLANRGYAVLCVNFRASTGFGKAFINAGDREWGGKVQHDQIDAVTWAIDAGIADKDRIAVFGGSFGGYSVLAGLTFTPEVFACGVDLVGISNLITFIESVPPYWKPLLRIFVQRIGDTATEEGRKRLQEQSPLTYVDRIDKPLLIGQGANDPRVRKAESDQIVAAMQAKDIPVTYLLYPDEGHGFARPENNLSFYAVTEAFLARNLGGRVEPIGDDVAGSSMQVQAGAEYIKELQDAITD